MGAAFLGPQSSTIRKIGDGGFALTRAVFSFVAGSRDGENAPLSGGAGIRWRGGNKKRVHFSPNVEMREYIALDRGDFLEVRALRSLLRA